MLRAQRQRAAFIVSPCCVGKLKFSTTMAGSLVTDGLPPAGTGKLSAVQHGTYDQDKDHGHTGNELDRAQQADSVTQQDGLHLQHPRSLWMQRSSSVDAFMKLAKAADISHTDDHAFPELAQAAKVQLMHRIATVMQSAVAVI